MTDSIRLNEGVGGDLFAADEIGGVKFGRSKIVIGADGVNDGDVSSSNPMPSQLYGIADGGGLLPVPVTAEGHIEVAIHGPINPFGSVHAESLFPVFQSDAVYQINPGREEATTGRAIAGATSATASVVSNEFTCSTGTTAYSFATLQSRRRLRYRAGQGVVGRFAGRFTSGVAQSIQVIGFGTAESGFYFGYNGTSFGILHVTGGVREIHTLTITTASTSTNDYQVTLPNSTVVTVSGATNSGSTARTAYEISKGTFPGWLAEANGSTVVFINSSAGPITGSFSLAQSGAGTPAAGTDAETKAGVSSTDTWIPQASWNGDKLDGTGPSGVTLDPTKANVYQIGIQYLGAGPVTFMIEAGTSGNNPDFVAVHRIEFQNFQAGVSVTQPSFPFTMASYSAGSTSDVVVRCSSYAGFTEGEQVLLGPRLTYTGSATSNTSTFTPLYTVLNSRYYQGRANQSVVKMLSISGAAKSTNGLTAIYLIRNANLTAGNPNFTLFDSASPTYVDKAATTCTYTNERQIQFVGYAAESDSFNYAFSDREITLQPGETLTVAAKSVTNTATIAVALNTREDQ